MRKKITFLMAISAMLFLGALNANGQTETIIFHETFNKLTTENTTKNGLTSGNTDEIDYTVGGGGSGMLCSENGTMDLTGGRFQTRKFDMTGDDVTLHITYKNLSGTGRFQIDIDKTGTSGMGGIFTETGEAAPKEFTTKTFTITTGTAESYLHFRVESNTTFVIDEIKVTKLVTTGVPTITSFSIDGISATIDQEAETITAELPFGTNLTSIEPTVVLGGTAKSYTPTGAQDFSNSGTTPVEYVVTDGTKSKTYKVTLTVQAVAHKELTELIFSNSFNAFIVGEIVTAYYMAGQEAPTIKSYKASEGASVALSEDKSMVVVTGSDNSTRELTLTLAPVTPFSGETPLKFDGSEAWIKTRNAFDASKGWVFSKDVEEESNKRISEGKSRVYFFVGNYEKLTFTSGTASRAVKVYINGVEQPSPTATAAAGSTFDIALSGGTLYMVEISSNKTNGDGGVTNLTTTPNVLTSVKQTLIKNVSFDGKTIQNPNNIKLNVFDISGRRVITSNQNIEMSGKHSGIYIVTSDSGAMKINVR